MLITIDSLNKRWKDIVRFFGCRSMSKENDTGSSSVISGTPQIIGERVGKNGAINTHETWFEGLQSQEDLHNGTEGLPAIKSVKYEKGYQGEPLTHVISEGITPVIVIEPVGKNGNMIVKTMMKNNGHQG